MATTHYPDFHYDKRALEDWEFEFCLNSECLAGRFDALPMASQKDATIDLMLSEALKTSRSSFAAGRRPQKLANTPLTHELLASGSRSLSRSSAPNDLRWCSCGFRLFIQSNVVEFSFVILVQM